MFGHLDDATLQIDRINFLRPRRDVAVSDHRSSNVFKCHLKAEVMLIHNFCAQDILSCLRIAGSAVNVFFVSSLTCIDGVCFCWVEVHLWLTLTAEMMACCDRAVETL